MSNDGLQKQIVKYLLDVHSIEENAVSQLTSGVENCRDEALTDVLGEHLVESEEHERLVRARLQALGESPSMPKGAAALTGAAAEAAPDTTWKIAIQAFTTEFLEIASYRSLRAVAEHAGDHETELMAERILAQEHAAAHKLDGLLEQAALVSLPHTVAVA